MTVSAAANGPMMPTPYAVPSRLSPDLARVRAYWAGLLRGQASLPFWDDVRLTDLPDLVGRLLLIDVFDQPERFRFNSIGKTLTTERLAGRFLDELRLNSPFEFLASQCIATVESAACTWFRQERSAASPLGRGYARLLLPIWGDGLIGSLLCAYDFD
jgi:hypothetical protein